jgi:hypothetical protein
VSQRTGRDQYDMPTRCIKQLTGDGKLNSSSIGRSRSEVSYGTWALEGGTWKPMRNRDATTGRTRHAMAGRSKRIEEREGVE